MRQPRHLGGGHQHAGGAHLGGGARKARVARQELAAARVGGARHVLAALVDEVGEQGGQARDDAADAHQRHGEGGKRDGAVVVAPARQHHEVVGGARAAQLRQHAHALVHRLDGEARRHHLRVALRRVAAQAVDEQHDGGGGHNAGALQVRRLARRAADVGDGAGVARLLHQRAQRALVLVLCQHHDGRDDLRVARLVEELAQERLQAARVDVARHDDVRQRRLRRVRLVPLALKVQPRQLRHESGDDGGGHHDGDGDKDDGGVRGDGHGRPADDDDGHVQHGAVEGHEVGGRGGGDLVDAGGGKHHGQHRDRQHADLALQGGAGRQGDDAHHAHDAEDAEDAQRARQRPPLRVKRVHGGDDDGHEAGHDGDVVQQRQRAEVELEAVVRQVEAQGVVRQEVQRQHQLHRHGPRRLRVGGRRVAVHDEQHHRQHGHGGLHHVQQVAVVGLAVQERLQLDGQRPPAQLLVGQHQALQPLKRRRRARARAAAPARVLHGMQRAHHGLVPPDPPPAAVGCVIAIGTISTTAANGGGGAAAGQAAASWFAAACAHEEDGEGHRQEGDDEDGGVAAH